ncbi:MAG: lipoyl(octanoyl) transferase LipB [Pseudomonadota bacterium]
MGKDTAAVEWAISSEYVDYLAAKAWMEQRARSIRTSDEPECVWLLEHRPLYTAGTTARAEDLLQPGRFPVFEAGRGGEFTYHGPGQRVAYVMLDVGRRGRDVRKFVAALEQWIIATLASFNVDAGTRGGRVGVWVDRSAELGAGREDKIAALGIRLKRWVSFHGVSLNVDPDLSHFKGITPCGISDPKFGVTSLEDLGRVVSLAEIDAALRLHFEETFSSPTVPVAAPNLPTA